MPYKEIERRRACSRESKRRSRARPANPVMEFRAYICPHLPNFRVGPNAAFRDGFFVTDRPELQNMVEAHPHFGRHILRLALCSQEND